MVRFYSRSIRHQSAPYADPAMPNPACCRSSATRRRSAATPPATARRCCAPPRSSSSDCGFDAVTMDAVAAKAGVGKGTVFRRFDSREGLMGALLNASETDWQASVMSRPAAAGPGRRADGAAARVRPLPAGRWCSSTRT